LFSRAPYTRMKSRLSATFWASTPRVEFIPARVGSRRRRVQVLGYG
jgi:hypothetical protein